MFVARSCVRLTRRIQTVVIVGTVWWTLVVASDERDGDMHGLIASRVLVIVKHFSCSKHQQMWIANPVKSVNIHPLHTNRLFFLIILVQKITSYQPTEQLMLLLIDGTWGIDGFI